MDPAFFVLSPLLNFLVLAGIPVQSSPSPSSEPDGLQSVLPFYLYVNDERVVFAVPFHSKLGLFQGLHCAMAISRLLASCHHLLLKRLLLECLQIAGRLNHLYSLRQTL